MRTQLNQCERGCHPDTSQAGWKHVVPDKYDDSCSPARLRVTNLKSQVTHSKKTEAKESFVERFSSFYLNKKDCSTFCVCTSISFTIKTTHLTSRSFLSCCQNSSISSTSHRCLIGLIHGDFGCQYNFSNSLSCCLNIPELCCSVVRCIISLMDNPFYEGCTLYHTSVTKTEEESLSFSILLRLADKPFVHKGATKGHRPVQPKHREWRVDHKTAFRQPEHPRSDTRAPPVSNRKRERSYWSDHVAPKITQIRPHTPEHKSAPSSLEFNKKRHHDSSDKATFSHVCVHLWHFHVW